MPDFFKLQNPFIKIYGIGPELAEELNKNYNKKQDIYDYLKSKKDILPEITKKYIKYKPSHSFPRKIVPNFPEGVICGSYRRLKPLLGDIDLLFENKEQYEKFKQKYNLIYLAEGPEIIRTLFKIKHIYVQLDIFIIPENANYYTYLLYLTGSKEFNIRIRQQAKKKNCKLNQNNLICNDKIIKINSEKDIFEYLEFPYLEPENR